MVFGVTSFFVYGNVMFVGRPSQFRDIPILYITFEILEPAVENC